MNRCWANVLFWIVVAILGVGSMLSGCGQKGPLYLPDHKQSSQQRDDGR